MVMGYSVQQKGGNYNGSFLFLCRRHCTGNHELGVGLTVVVMCHLTELLTACYYNALFIVL